MRRVTNLAHGQDKPLDKTAALTRSLASRTAASGRPTIVNPGKPLDTWTSTETEHPTAPLSIAEFTAANMPKNGRRDTTGVQKHFSRYRKRERRAFACDYLCQLGDLTSG